MNCAELRTTISSLDDTIMVACVGEVDLSSVAVLREALDQALGAGPDLVVVDFSRLSFLDSTGINCLVHAFNAGAEVGCRVVVRNAAGMVRRVLELTALDDLLFDLADRAVGDRPTEGVG